MDIAAPAAEIIESIVALVGLFLLVAVASAVPGAGRQLIIRFQSVSGDGLEGHLTSMGSPVVEPTPVRPRSNSLRPIRVVSRDRPCAIPILITVVTTQLVPIPDLELIATILFGCSRVASGGSLWRRR